MTNENAVLGKLLDWMMQFVMVGVKLVTLLVSCVFPEIYILYMVIGL